MRTSAAQQRPRSPALKSARFRITPCRSEQLSSPSTYRCRPGILHRTDMFATIDNSINLPGYTRVDAAGFVTFTGQLRMQVNVENLFDKTYYMNADSNTNISFGSPRAVRVGLVARF
jgi:outer membrane receptor protein involved in Fe transport